MRRPVFGAAFFFLIFTLIAYFFACFLKFSTTHPPFRLFFKKFFNRASPLFSRLFRIFRQDFLNFSKKIFPKPLDKSNFYAIIKLQRERNKQKMFKSFKMSRERKPMHN